MKADEELRSSVGDEYTVHSCPSCGGHNGYWSCRYGAMVCWKCLEVWLPNCVVKALDRIAAKVDTDKRMVREWLDL